MMKRLETVARSAVYGTSWPWPGVKSSNALKYICHVFHAVHHKVNRIRQTIKVNFNWVPCQIRLPNWQLILLSFCDMYCFCNVMMAVKARQFFFNFFCAVPLCGNFCVPVVYQKVVKDPMKSIPFVPKTIPAGGASQSPLDRLSVDWNRSKWWSFSHESFITASTMTFPFPL